MHCSSPNLLVNGGFRRGLAPWRGRAIRLLPNPVRSGDTSVRIRPRGLLYQNVPGRFLAGCAYYLYFRILNANSSQVQPRMYAVVSWLDGNRRILRSTPLLVEPPRPSRLRFTSFFTIVPQPPAGARIMSVVFLVERAPLLVDYISIVARDVGTPRAMDTETPRLISFPS